MHHLFDDDVIVELSQLCVVVTLSAQNATMEVRVSAHHLAAPSTLVVMYGPWLQLLKEPICKIVENVCGKEALVI